MGSYGKVVENNRLKPDRSKDLPIEMDPDEATEPYMMEPYMMDYEQVEHFREWQPSIALSTRPFPDRLLKLSMQKQSTFDFSTIRLVSDKTKTCDVEIKY